MSFIWRLERVISLNIRDNLTYTKQKYTILSDNKPYLFIGSKIRGMLGYELKNNVCINPTLKCDGCFATKECLFYNMFEEKNKTHSYRLDYKLYSKKYKFSLILFGDTKKESDTLHRAMIDALKEYQAIDYQMKTKTLSFDGYSENLKIKLLTPLRIKKHNRFATKDIELLDILLSIYRRDLELQSIPYRRANFEINYTTVSKNLNYTELTRKSNRQDTKMYLGGLMGEIIVNGVSREIYELLKLGEIIGVGKSTVFGLGKIKVEDL